MWQSMYLINFNKAFRRARMQDSECFPEPNKAAARRGIADNLDLFHGRFKVSTEQQIKDLIQRFHEGDCNPALSASICLWCRITPCQCLLKTRVLGMFDLLDMDLLWLDWREFLAVHMSLINSIWVYNEWQSQNEIDTRIQQSINQFLQDEASFSSFILRLHQGMKLTCFKNIRLGADFPLHL
jgi:hypothetical protein